MTPLEQRVQMLENEIQALRNAGSIPNDTEQAFRTRFQLDSVTLITASSKSATSENKAVNEAGASSYSVMGIPDGYLKTIVGGATFHLPAFTS